MATSKKKKNFSFLAISTRNVLLLVNTPGSAYIYGRAKAICMRPAEKHIFSRKMSVRIDFLYRTPVPHY